MFSKKIEYTNKWDEIIKTNVAWLDKNNNVICSYTYETYPEEDYSCLAELYVQPPYRKMGWSEIMLKNVLEQAKEDGKINWLCVKKDNFIKGTYERLGWKYEKDDENNNYEWMTNVGSN